MNMFQPMEQSKDKVLGANEVISCDNFRRGEAEGKKYDMNNFFSVNKDKLILNKYNKYKLYSKL